MRFQFLEGKACEPFEYFCKDCRLMILSFVETDTCSTCDGSNIVKGKVGELDKEELLK